MKTQNPIIGRSKGSAGGMTFCKVYDKNVARAKAFEVSNPKTQAQQTERGFFAQLMGAVATVSEDQLRSIFPQKPKTKSRRNMLTTQLSSAFSVDGTTKSLDYSKIEQFGNGAQSRCPLLKMTEHFSNGSFLLNPAWAPDFVANQTSFVLVVFHGVTGAITMYDIPPVDPERPEEPEPVEVPEYPEPDPMDYGVCLPTLDGKDHSGDAFGTYAVMSMNKNGGTQPSPTPPTPSYPTLQSIAAVSTSESSDIYLQFDDDLPEGVSIGAVNQIIEEAPTNIANNWTKGYIKGQYVGIIVSTDVAFNRTTTVKLMENGEIVSSQSKPLDEA